MQRPRALLLGGLPQLYYGAFTSYPVQKTGNRSGGGGSPGRAAEEQKARGPQDSNGENKKMTRHEIACPYFTHYF